MIHEPKRRRIAEIKPENIPLELKEGKHFLMWRLEQVNGTGVETKVPRQTNGKKAKSPDPTTHTTFDEVMAAWERGGYSGIGRALMPEDEYLGVDLDHCRNPETGEILPAALEIVRALDSYTEITPSLDGLRVWVRAKKPAGGWSSNKGNKNRPCDVEVYDRARFFALTGWHLTDTPRTVEARQRPVEELLASHTPQAMSSPDRKPYTGSPDDVLGLEDFLQEHNVKVSRRINDGSSELAYGIVCPWAHEHTGGDTSGTRVGQYPSGALWFKCDHAHCAGRTWEQFREHFDPKAYRRVDISVGGRKSNVVALPSRAERAFNTTDLGNAERFVYHHGENVRYVYPWGAWLVYDGMRWKKDDSGMVQRLAKDTVRAIYREAGATEDEAQRKALAKHAASSESETRIRAMIELAKSEVPVSPDKLDAAPYLLNAPNGTIDLRTGELREHSREDLITKLAPVEYDHSAQAPVFESFLARVLPSAAVRAFVQRAAGYSATGDTSEQCMLIHHGPGANGKSTFQEITAAALGDYAMRTPTETLLAKRAGGVPNDVARLKGARFVTASETEEGRRLDESLIKDLTGQDTISARFMRAEWFDFIPTHKLHLSTNHKPEIRGTDTAIWRRIRLVPWAVSIPEAEQDKQLVEKLRAELPGALAWIVRGCLAWHSEGLNAPDEVRAATNAYRSEMDRIGDFISDRCYIGDGFRVNKDELYKAYQAWCEEGGERSITKRKFGTRMKERGYEDGHNAGRTARIWKGIGLSSITRDPTDGADGEDASAPSTVVSEGVFGIDTLDKGSDPGGYGHNGPQNTINNKKIPREEVNAKKASEVSERPKSPQSPPGVPREQRVKELIRQGWGETQAWEQVFGRDS